MNNENSTLATPALSTTKTNILRRLYYWTLSLAQKKHAVSLLFIVSFIESIFFPIPPDIIQIALCYANPKKSFWYAFVSLVGSVSGALVGYAIGYIVKEPIINFLTVYVTSQGTVDQVIHYFQINAFFWLFAAAFTPIPYKVFTLSAGIMQINLLVFIVASILGRGGRFFLVGGLIYLFGDKVKPVIEKKLEFITVTLTLLLVLGVLLLK
ncbi:MAG: DedA family protein [Planctomycetes bacterium]|nr:DedA family protein [Planctomycetota bacterium]